MRVREAHEADLDEVCALLRELAAYEKLDNEVVFDREELGRHLFGPERSAHVLMAESDDGSVAGFALWFATLSTFEGRAGIWLEDLFVRPQYRGTGMGRALLEGLRSRTAGRVEWAVLDWNEAAIGFYQRLGAKPVTGWTRYRW